MIIPESFTPTSIFASIDKRSESFVDNPELARNFTRMVIDRATDFSENVEMVHLGESSAIPGENAYRRYAIWQENGKHFGAWIYLPTSELKDIENEVLYPHILGTVTKKSRQIVEDVYYIESLNIPIEWVTYHNTQQ